MSAYQRQFTYQLASALLTGPWLPEQLHQRLITTLGEAPPWGPALVGKIHQRFQQTAETVSVQQLARFIADDPGFQAVWSSQRDKLRIRSYPLDPPPAPTPRLTCETPTIIMTG